MGRILNFQTSNKCMITISPFFQQMIWNRQWLKIRGFLAELYKWERARFTIGATNENGNLTFQGHGMSF